MVIDEQVKQKIIAALLPYNPKYIGIFGSFARNEGREDSDLDILTEFEAPVGLKFFGIAEELEPKLGIKVDLHTPGSISKYILPDIRKELAYIYEKTS